MARILESKYGVVIDGLNGDYRYDLSGYSPRKGRNVTFEVKEDTRTKDTGNILVEYESWGKPSGVAVSTADYWVFRIHGNTRIVNFVVSLDALKRLIDGGGYFRKGQMHHTDSSNRLYFFKASRIMDIAVLAESDISP